MNSKENIHLAAQKKAANPRAARRGGGGEEEEEENSAGGNGKGHHRRAPKPSAGAGGRPLQTLAVAGAPKPKKTTPAMSNQQRWQQMPPPSNQRRRHQETPPLLAAPGGGSGIKIPVPWGEGPEPPASLLAASARSGGATGAAAPARGGGGTTPAQPGPAGLGQTSEVTNIDATRAAAETLTPEQVRQAALDFVSRTEEALNGMQMLEQFADDIEKMDAERALVAEQDAQKCIVDELYDQFSPAIREDKNNALSFLGALVPLYYKRGRGWYYNKAQVKDGKVYVSDDDKTFSHDFVLTRSISLKRWHQKISKGNMEGVTAQSLQVVIQFMVRDILADYDQAMLKNLHSPCPMNAALAFAGLLCKKTEKDLKTKEPTILVEIGIGVYHQRLPPYEILEARVAAGLEANEEEAIEGDRQFKQFTMRDGLAWTKDPVLLKQHMIWKDGGTEEEWNIHKLMERMNNLESQSGSDSDSDSVDLR